MLKGAGRVLGMLDISDDTPATDVKTLVGFFLGEAYTPLVDMPLMHPKYFWAADLLEGFGTYINFWMWKLKKMKVVGEAGSLDKYQDCLELLQNSLKSGHWKRCNEYKDLSFHFLSLPSLSFPFLSFPFLSFPSLLFFPCKQALNHRCTEVRRLERSLTKKTCKRTRYP